MAAAKSLPDDSDATVIDIYSMMAASDIETWKIVG